MWGGNMRDRGGAEFNGMSSVADNAVGLRGPSAKLLMIAFARMWRYVNAGGKISNTELLHNKDAGEFGILVQCRRGGARCRRCGKCLRRGEAEYLLTMSYFAPAG